MRYRRTLLLLALAVITAATFSCGLQAEDTSTANARGLDRANLDTTCAPCEDFYQYANGGWAAMNPIPEDEAYWGASKEVMKRNNEILRTILEESAASDAEPGTIAQKIGDFYYSAMDSTRAESEGVQPIQGDLDKVAAITDVEDLVALLNDYHGTGIGYVFDIGAMQDLVNSNYVTLYLTSSGLGLPDRDYYLREDDESVTLRNQYVEHVANMLQLVGDSPNAAQEAADKILDIETRLANVTLTAVEANNPANWYGMKTLDEAKAMVPNMNWEDFRTSIGLPNLESFSMAPDKFFTELNDMLVEVPIEDWKSYLRWQIAKASAPFLSSDFVDESFRFYGTILTGQKESSPRWKKAKSSVSGLMGEALGRLFVERAFSPAAKARALEMVENLKIALRERIEGLEWMGPETKEKALAKLDAFRAKIGYPDEWKDYSSLEIVEGPWIENVLRAIQFNMHEEMEKVGKPPDRKEWVTNPQTVNAFYHPLMNDITFPAGILQPPFFDVDIDDAVNYGCMGVVIGHEMTHGFDNNGRRFDADGNMTDWWTTEDSDKFTELSQGMIDQFDGYVAIDSLHVNGELTLGENISDRAGLLIAYRALQLAREGKEDPMVDGFTQEQRFYLSFAQFFRTNFTPEILKLIVNTDPHSPSRFRVNGPLSHITEFAEAFGCKEGEKMYTPPDQQVHVW